MAECDELRARPHVERFFLATGRLLPIWNLLGDDPQVRRLVTADSHSLLGRIVPHADVSNLLGKLGITASVRLRPEEIVAAALDGRTVAIDQARGLSLRVSRVDGDRRLELLGFDPRALASFKAKGCFTEIIQHKTRLFVPRNQADQIVKMLLS